MLELGDEPRARSLSVAAREAFAAQLGAGDHYKRSLALLGEELAARAMA